MFFPETGRANTNGNAGFEKTCQDLSVGGIARQLALTLHVVEKIVERISFDDYRGEMLS